MQCYPCKTVFSLHFVHLFLINGSTKNITSFFHREIVYLLSFLTNVILQCARRRARARAHTHTHTHTITLSLSQFPRAHLHVVGMLQFMSDINQPGLPTPFCSVLVSVSVFMTLSAVFHSINSPDNSPLSHSVLPVSFLPYWSFQL